MSRADEPIYKGQVADLIHRVENGVDEFQKYLNNTRQDAKNHAATTRRQSANSTQEIARLTNGTPQAVEKREWKNDRAVYRAFKSFLRGAFEGGRPPHSSARAA